jgi:ABC-2 type transport system ATP-binding protein
LRREQRTILLTTHYIEEAEKLCDRVAIIDDGRMVAIGTPREIQAQTAGASIIEIECQRCFDGQDLPRWREAESVATDETHTRIRVTSSQPAQTIVDIMKWLEQQGIGLADIHVKRPSLEDAFLELTGKNLRE